LGIGLRRAVQQNPEARNPRQLLRARNRNRNNRAANKRYKFTSSHGASEGNASTNGGNLALSAQVASYKRRSIGSEPNVRFGSILLQKSKIKRPRKSRQSRSLDSSAGVSLFSAIPEVRDRF
jgi:hypothetical protein